MKKLLNTIKVAVLIVAASMTMNSCDSWLELYPEGETLLEDFWKTADDIESVLATCYLSLMDEASIKNMIIWGEARSDNMEQASKSDADLLDLLDVNLAPTNTYCNWAAFYKTINYCNTVIYYAPGVMDEDENLSTARMEAYRAEARAIRAMCYFYLVRTFGDVPLVLEPTIDDTKGFAIAKTPGDEVLRTITTDLEEALSYAQTTFGSYRPDYNVSRFTRQSIRVLLADMMLWQNRYEECVYYCDEFLKENQKYELQAGLEYHQLGTIDSWLSMFTSSNISNYPEVIFATAYGPSIMDNTMLGIYGHEQKDPVVSAAEELVENYSYLFESTDKRKLYISGGTENVGNVRNNIIAKYICRSIVKVGNGYNAVNNTEKMTDWVYYRMADVYLLRAEALVEIANTKTDEDEKKEYLNDAIYMINKTFMRANDTRIATDTLELRDYPNVDLMRDLVLDERQREFMFEGKRWFDLVRFARRAGDPQVAIDAVEGKRFPNSSENVALNKMSEMNALYMPIFQTEIDNNDLLIQNPFYQMDESTSTQK